MPKVIDREQHKHEIALHAAQLFIQHGYSQLGMRQLALELGVSKSALYHYFPSKDALFAASIEAMTQDDMKLSALPSAATVKDRITALMTLMQTIEMRFAGELGLVLDYIRGKDSNEVRADKNIQLADQRYLELIAHCVGEEKAELVFNISLGILLRRLMNGQATPWSDLEDWLLLNLE